MQTRKPLRKRVIRAELDAIKKKTSCLFIPLNNKLTINGLWANINENECNWGEGELNGVDVPH